MKRRRPARARSPQVVQTPSCNVTSVCKCTPLTMHRASTLTHPCAARRTGATASQPSLGAAFDAAAPADLGEPSESVVMATTMTTGELVGETVESLKDTAQAITGLGTAAAETVNVISNNQDAARAADSLKETVEALGGVVSGFGKALAAAQRDWDEQIEQAVERGMDKSKEAGDSGSWAWACACAALMCLCCME